MFVVVSPATPSQPVGVCPGNAGIVHLCTRHRHVLPGAPTPHTHACMLNFLCLLLCVVGSHRVLCCCSQLQEFLHVGIDRNAGPIAALTARGVHALVSLQGTPGCPPLDPVLQSAPVATPAKAPSGRAMSDSEPREDSGMSAVR